MFSFFCSDSSRQGQKHAGVSIETGAIQDAVEELHVLDSLLAKRSAIQLATDAATTILRVDQVRGLLPSCFFFSLFFRGTADCEQGRRRTQAPADGTHGRRLTLEAERNTYFLLGAMLCTRCQFSNCGERRCDVSVVAVGRCSAQGRVHAPNRGVLFSRLPKKRPSVAKRSHKMLSAQRHDVVMSHDGLFLRYFTAAWPTRARCWWRRSCRTAPFGSC